MYRDAKHLEENKKITDSSGFIQLKNSVDIGAMTKSIENIEEQYKKSFVESFWTPKCKQIFNEALNAKFANIELPDDIYESVIKEALTV